VERWKSGKRMMRRKRRRERGRRRRRRIWQEGKGALDTGVTSEEMEADEDIHPEEREGSFSRRDVILIDTSRTGQPLEDRKIINIVSDVDGRTEEWSHSD
jgi:hypothetical protein